MGVVSDLVKAVAQIEGLDEVSVGVYARHAREAGFITHQGRGRHAARMTVRDAANLLIAVNASPLAKEVPNTIERYRSLRKSPRSLVLDMLGGLDDEATLGDALEKAIEWCIRDADGNCKMRGILDKADPERVHREAKREKFQLLPAMFTISFGRPSASVEMKLLGTTHWRDIGTIKTEYFARSKLIFETNHSSEDMPDRQDTATITHRTLMRVADILQA
ncbi:hypothetical protein DC522_19110 [Microvirga sp. KLBC 81]|uniref:hypothetical protein n=1 Tax=Microvirga sp. KLBC 81 TaxID=1862707 RepID=UPI000D519175|nr:hypothetical protein [Microvirga sp. KLBC 81]PVE22849.1 hypothetical protein DC522_19110 [Microvirga sp. KLBC 81]